MGVEAFSAELPVERLDEGIVRGLSPFRGLQANHCRAMGSGEVECDAALIGPQVKVAADELGTLVNAYAGRKAMGRTDRLQHLDDVGVAEVEANVEPRREPAEGVDDGQNPQLAAGGELVMDKVHSPDLIRSRRRTAIVAQLRLDPTLGCLVPELETQLLVKSVDPLWIDIPALAFEQHMNPAIAVTHACLGDLLDPLDEAGLPGPSGAVVIGRTLDWQSAASTTDAHLPGRAHMIDHQPLAGRPQS